MMPPVPAGFDTSTLPTWPAFIPAAAVVIYIGIVALFVKSRSNDKHGKFERKNWSPML